MKYVYILICLTIVFGCATTKKQQPMDRITITLENIAILQERGHHRMALCMKHQDEQLQTARIIRLFGWRKDPQPNYKVPDNCIPMRLPSTPTPTKTPTFTASPTLTSIPTTVPTFTATATPTATETASPTMSPTPNKDKRNT